MAVVKGVNCGFVEVAPTDDPGASTMWVDDFASAFKDVAPAEALKVTEIGWWCNNATQAANFEVGIYNHDAIGDSVTTVVGWDKTNAKGTTSGWKRVSGLNIPIIGGTTYWIALQVDSTATRTQGNWSSDGQRWVIKTAATLTDPWGVQGGVNTTLVAFYAVWEAVSVSMKINIGDVFKDVSEVKINVGDSWKTVTKAQINIGDVWKTIFG